MADRAPESYDFSDIPDPAPKAAVVPAAVAPTEAAPTRAQRERRTLIAEVAVGCWLLAAVFRLGVRDDMGLALLAKVAALCVVGLVAQRLASAPGRALGPRLRVAQAVVLGVPASFLVFSVVSGRGDADAGMAAHQLSACFGTTLVVGLVPITFAALLHVRAFATLPAWRGAALGALGGLMGSIVVGVHCAVDAIPHVLIAHGGPIVIGAGVGATLGALRGKV